MTTNPEIPGRYEQVYTITVNRLLDFEPLKADLVALEGVEDVLFDDQSSPCQMRILSDGTVPKATVQQLVARHGFQAQLKKLLIS